MKGFLFVFTITIITSCGHSLNKENKETQKDISANISETENIKNSRNDLIEFKGAKFSIGYPISWSLNQEEMNNPSSIALLSANKKITYDRAITFQLINLVDTASLESGVKNLIMKYSKNPYYTELKRSEVNDNVFINTRIRFAINASSESYFLKDGDDLFWLTFMGHVIDLDEHIHEFRAMVESFKLNKEKL